MSKNNLYWLLWASAIFVCPSCLAQPVSNLGCAASVLDNILADSARVRIVYGLPSMDFAKLYPGDNGYPNSVMPEMREYKLPGDSVVLRVDEMTLLAWHIKRIGPALDVRSALIWSRYLNVDSTDGWALLVLSSDVGEPDDIDKPEWIAPERADQPLMRYTHAPTNEDVHAFLDQLNGIEGRMLSYNGKGVYDWEGVKIMFMGGEVCKETWEEVIGEKPLNLFPHTE